MTTSDFATGDAGKFAAAPYVVCVAGALPLIIFGEEEHALRAATQKKAK